MTGVSLHLKVSAPGQVQCAERGRRHGNRPQGVCVQGKREDFSQGEAGVPWCPRGSSLPEGRTCLSLPNADQSQRGKVKADRSVHGTQHSTQRVGEQGLGGGSHLMMDSTWMSTGFTHAAFGVGTILQGRIVVLSHRMLIGLRESRFQGSEFHVSQ